MHDMHTCMDAPYTCVDAPYMQQSRTNSDIYMTLVFVQVTMEKLGVGMSLTPVLLQLTSTLMK